MIFISFLIIWILSFFISIYYADKYGYTMLDSYKLGLIKILCPIINTVCVILFTWKLLTN